MKELPKSYDHTSESHAYQQWESSGFFNPDNLPGERKESFSISMPPPNVTGNLHIGHAMFLTIEDLMTRYHRMKGDRTLWLPGVDHAAIATQNVVEKKIYKEEGKSRHEVGREVLVQRINAFVATTRSNIENQIRRMGSSCDWGREKYTLDEGLSRAVRTVFVRMYNDGLIYRGNRMVNWCPRCKSTLADDEVEYKEQKTKFYYFKYGPVIIGTARPETKFLDKTIIVHPDDMRYKNITNKELDVEWIEGKVKANVIADPIVDMAFGTGAMTITPAHSFEDFELAKKYHLPVVQIIDEHGNLTQAAGTFAGQNAREAREAIVEQLRAKGLVDHIDENYVHNLSMCYRCGTPIEPLPSLQWFVAVDKPFTINNSKLAEKFGKKTATLKELSLWAVRSQAITIIPDRFNKTYFQWMENLHDWCISRQIWFGHQIPVWYCKNGRMAERQNGQQVVIPAEAGIQKQKQTKTQLCANPIVNVDDTTSCPHCSGPIEQDPDTLDTWFSSALWTFSTLGWPDETKEFKTFHPTTVMETGYDILFFWVARMIIMSMYAIGDVPFRTVYLHGLVRDQQGHKMSKSLGNVIDPLTMVEKFGTDPVRLSLVVGMTPGNDTRLNEEKIASYRNFVNKLWNIGRFILTTTPHSLLTKEGVAERRASSGRPGNRGDLPPQTLADQWILAKLNSIIERTTKDMEEFYFGAAIETLYEFTWHEFADWYLEIAKFQRAQGLQESTDAILLYTLEQILKLWHPFTPFITEELWSHSRGIPAEVGIQKETTNKNDLLLIQSWPETPTQHSYNPMSTNFEILQVIITAIRVARAETKLNVKEHIEGFISCKTFQQTIIDHLDLIEYLTKARLAIVEKIENPLITLSCAQISLNLPETKSVKKEDPQNLLRYMEQLKSRLADPSFVAKAPPHVVEKERQRLREIESLLSQ